MSAVIKAKDEKLNTLAIQMKDKETKLETMDKNLRELNRQVSEKEHENLRREIDTLKVLQKTKLVGYFQWNITEYSHKRSLKECRSLPFYTLNGYNCSLRAEWSGRKRKFFGIYICHNVGERDDDLVWPFNMKVTFECCCADACVRHILDISDPERIPFRGKPDPQSESNTYGHYNFLSYPQLNKFIKNDSIVINCYIETIDEK